MSSPSRFGNGDWLFIGNSWQKYIVLILDGDTPNLQSWTTSDNLSNTEA